MLLKFIFSILIFASLLGCASHSYVESDIPGVAEWIGGRVIEYHTRLPCPVYSTGYAGYSAYQKYTTPAGFTRARVEYNLQCH
jgi:hypothetical protein